MYTIGKGGFHASLQIPVPTTGETVVLFRRLKRRQEIVELLEALMEKHPTRTIYVAWENASMHEDGVVEAVVRGAVGRMVLLYLMI